MLLMHAKLEEGDDDSSGVGFGFVDVYWRNGTLAKHFAAHGTLNAPWGIAEAAPELLGKSALLLAILVMGVLMFLIGMEIL